MKSVIGVGLACGFALLAAGCAVSPRTRSTQPAVAPSSTPSDAVDIRDFNLRVKCPGIHLAKTSLKWSDEHIMSHYDVTANEIERCEAWQAAQPRGYVPSPVAGFTPLSGTSRSDHSP